MQLNLTPPLFSEILSFNCRQLLTSCLAGTVIVGTGSVLIFNSSISSKVNEAISPTLEKLALTPFGKGVSAIGRTISEWATSVVSAKDDFKYWVKSFLNIDGLKSGVAELYGKLKVWAEIVYNWFATKFLKFIENIPQMVKDWKKLRLSLFKWGTFLGGGGGSALWAMFGSSANWGRLAELMGDPEFSEALGTISELMDKNSEAFASMDKEEVETIVEKILESPKEANDIAKELLEEQKKEHEGKEGEPKELDKDKIKESFSKQKGGKPKSPQQALGNLIGKSLKILRGERVSSFTDYRFEARKAMKEHLDILRKESTGNSESSKVKKEFLDAIKESEDILIEELSKLAEHAIRFSDKKDFSSLAKKFETLMKYQFTVEIPNGTGDEEGVEIDNLIPRSNK